MADLVVGWVLFPAIQLVLWIGCGCAVEAVTGRRLSWVLVAPVGFCAVVVLGSFTTGLDATAELTAPLLVAVAVAGLAIRRPWRGERIPAGLPAVLAAVFAVYALPIVASGEATFAGYIRLDDTATWMAFTDQLMEHGRDLSSLAPSTHEVVLKDNLPGGYPLGAFVPLGVGSELVPSDVAWLVQPYMALVAGLLALALWELAGGLTTRAGLRATMAIVAAMPALLYGYYLWGGIKEVTAAMLIALVAVLAVRIATDRGGALRPLAPLALACAALIAVLSVAGAVWIGPLMCGAGLLLVRSSGWRPAALRAAVLVGLVAVLSIPTLATGALSPPTSSPLDADQAKGNLIESLEPAQVLGIWPAGDFRLDPVAELPTYVLCAVVLLLGLLGLVYAARARAWPLFMFCAGALIAGGAIAVRGSPWVDGKALATVSPAALLAAMAGAAALVSRPRWRRVGLAGLAVIAGGVVWSNALAYRDVNLAPRDQLAELEEIGEMVAGRGPALLTEYQPYGARHFLREADAEAASERRRRHVVLTDGSTLEKGDWADTDAFALDSLLPYNLLVLRRSPEQSRPPSPFRLIWSGDFYDVWERTPGAAPVAHLGLSLNSEPQATPSCEQIEALGAQAGPSGNLRAAPAPAPVFVPRDVMRFTREWADADGSPIPDGAGVIIAPVEVAAAGDYELWLGGSVRPAVTTFVDGSEAGHVSHQLNTSGLYVRLGEARLAPGRHRVIVEFSATGLRPGAGGGGSPAAPLVLTRKRPDGEPVDVAASDARSLCDRSWDWIEAFR